MQLNYIIELVEKNMQVIYENFDLLLFPFHSLYTFGVFFDDFGGFSKSSYIPTFYLKVMR